MAAAGVMASGIASVESWRGGGQTGRLVLALLVLCWSFNTQFTGAGPAASRDLGATSAFPRQAVRACNQTAGHSLHMDFYHCRGGNLEVPTACLSLALFHGSAGWARQLRTSHSHRLPCFSALRPRRLFRARQAADKPVPARRLRGTLASHWFFPLGPPVPRPAHDGGEPAAAGTHAADRSTPGRSVLDERAGRALV
jgi:hypothetical protein